MTQTKQYLNVCISFYLKIFICLTPAICSALSKDLTYLKWNEIKCSDDIDSDNCYNEIYEKIRINTQSVSEESLNKEKLNSLISGSVYQTTLVNGYSKISLLKSKPEWIIVTMNGLWHSSDQFSLTLNSLREIRGIENAFNSIDITLPGHIKSRLSSDYESYIQKANEKRPTASFKDWIDALNNTLPLAKALGKKVILMGHSTGGLLSAIAAKKYKTDIDALILIEPALQVKQFRDVGSCVLGNLPPNIIQFFGDIATEYFDSPPVKKHADLGMGCEIQKMADSDFVQRIYPGQLDQNLTNNFKYELTVVPDSSIEREDLYTKEDMSPYANAGSSIAVPFLLFNNINDVVVSPIANIYFWDGVKKMKKYYPIEGKNSKGKPLAHSQFINEKYEDLAFKINLFINDL